MLINDSCCWEHQDSVLCKGGHASRLVMNYTNPAKIVLLAGQQYVAHWIVAL